MELKSLLRDVSRRYNEYNRKQKKPRIQPSLIEDVGNRFRSFVKEQSQEGQPLHKITRTIQELPLVTQREVDEVGTRFRSFVDERQKNVDDVGKRFGEFKVKASQFSKDYDPFNFDEKAPINQLPVLGDIRRTLQPYTNPYKLGPMELMRRNTELMQKESKGIALTDEEKEFQKYYMTEQASMVMPMGTVGKVAKPALTALQKEAVKKLPKILYEFDAKTANKVIDEAKGASKEWVDEFKSWVNTRASAQLQGLNQRMKFKDMDSEGIAGIFKFQAGDKTGRFADVKKFFDSRYSELQKAGVEFRYKQEYLPQLWLNSKEEVEERLGRTLTSRPSFSLRSVIENYQKGIANGLKPRFQTLSELIGWYEAKTAKVIADQNFYNYMKKAKYILPEDTAPAWWKTIDSEKFPKFTVKVGSEVKNLNYKAEGRIADAINNYLNDPEGALPAFADFATKVKNLGLSAGVPHTSINFHGYNIFVRSVLASNNPVSSIFRTGQWMLKPKIAERFVMNNLEDAQYFVKNGMTMSTEDYGLFEAVEKVKKSGVINKTLDKYEEWFGDPLFKKSLPAIKIQYTRALFDDLLKTLPEEEAVKIAVKSANDVFGGINLNELMRNKQTQNVLRSVLLAPDWAESTIRMGKGIVKGVANPLSPEYKAYRTFAKNMVFGYITANVVNKALSGHWMFENEGNNKFNIDTGTYTGDGKKRYFRIWGTAVDFARLPVDIVNGLSKGDPSAFVRTFTNRLSMPVGSAGHLLFNKDYLGRPVYGKDQWGNEIDPIQSAGGITNEVLRGVGTPTQVMAGIDLLTGRSNPEQALAQSLELPMRYQGGASSDTQKRRNAAFQSLGFEGEALAREMERTKGMRYSGSQGEEKSLLDHIGEKFMSVFGKKEPNRPQPNDPLTKAFLADIEKDENATRVREVFKLGLSKEQTEQLLEKEGLGTYEEAELIIMKALGVENGTRGNYIQEITKGMDDESKEATLSYLAENEILTTSVISQWVDDGEITDEEADYLKDLIKKSKGTYKGPKAKGGKKAGAKKVTAGSIPTIKIPTFAGGTVKSVSKAYYKPIPKITYERPTPTSKQKVSAPKPETNFKSYGGNN